MTTTISTLFEKMSEFTDNFVYSATSDNGAEIITFKINETKVIDPRFLIDIERTAIENNFTTTVSLLPNEGCLEIKFTEMLMAQIIEQPKSEEV